MALHRRLGVAEGDDLPALAPVGRHAQPDGRPRRGFSQPRLVEAASLCPDGEIRRTRHALPDHPVFLDAACALGRGTVLRTRDGPIAIEDLQPGDELLCVDGEMAPVLWIGSTVLSPSSEGHLTRIMPDAFGPGRPDADILAGPAARLLQEKPALARITGGPRLLMPAADFQDGMRAIGIAPPTPVRLYHVALARHTAIDVQGVLVESFHPGLRAADALGPNMRALFLSLFSHVQDFADFGAVAWPRVSAETVARLSPV